MNSTTIPASVISDWLGLASALKPAPGFVVTRHDEPADETIHTTEADAWADAESREGSAWGVAPITEQLTVGYTPERESWGYQTGDNSFTGGAYGHPVWAVVWIGADSDPAEVAREIADEIEEQIAQ